MSNATEDDVVDIAYVLVDPDIGALTTMTWLSIQTLRRFHPDSNVSIYVDDQTRAKLKDDSRFVGIRLVEQVPPPANPMIRSRWIKTRLMSLFECPTLFIDCDTLILRPLDALQRIEGELLAVPAWNAKPAPLVTYKHLREFYERLEWPVGDTIAFNSGVWLFRPTDRTRKLARLWPAIWEEGLAETAKDQPSLFTAIYQSGVSVTPISNCWNALVMHRPRMMRGACIAHFWCSMAYDGSLLSDLVSHAMQTGRVDWNQLESAVRSANPWSRKAEAWRYAKSGHWRLALGAKAKQLWRGRRSTGCG